MKSIPLRSIQPTEKEPDLFRSFTIRKVKDIRMGKGIVEPLHRHDFYFLLAIEKGKGSHSIDFQDYQVTNYSIYFMSPGQVHEHSMKAGGSGFLITFQPDFYPYHKDIKQKINLRQASQTNYYTLSRNDFKKLKLLFEQIYLEFEEQAEHYEGVIRSYLNILIVFMNRFGDSKRSVEEYSRLSVRLQELQELIEKNISITEKVSDYAKRMSLSTYQLNTITKKMLGKNCSELISEYIVLEAKRLLLCTTSQVNEIAFHLGFKDSSYFIRFFKKHIGTSPKVFRNNFR